MFAILSEIKSIISSMLVSLPTLVSSVPCPTTTTKTHVRFVCRHSIDHGSSKQLCCRSVDRDLLNPKLYKFAPTNSKSEVSIAKTAAMSKNKPQRHKESNVFKVSLQIFCVCSKIRIYSHNLKFPMITFSHSRCFVSVQILFGSHLSN